MGQITLSPVAWSYQNPNQSDWFTTGVDDEHEAYRSSNGAFRLILYRFRAPNSSSSGVKVSAAINQTGWLTCSVNGLGITDSQSTEGAFANKEFVQHSNLKRGLKSFTI